MTYVVRMFNGLEISPYLRAGDSQNMGTGAALTSFLPLPGGGFYDNYRDLKSPQGTRPINKSGLFWGTPTELRQELQAWRAMLGVRGRLTVEFDDGVLRWQWARLQDVNAPRPRENKGGWLQFALTWITAAQNWRGVVYGESDWTVEDGSFLIGDGSAEIGVGAQTFALTSSNQAVTVTHDGDIDAPNVTLRFETSGAWEDITIVNETTAQRISLDYLAAANMTLYEVNAGARSVYVGATAININSLARTSNTLLVTTTAAHGMVTGDEVRIDGTDIYDGDYYPVTLVGATSFSVALAATNSAYGTVLVGAMRQLLPKFTVTTFSDKARWLVLAPGDNVLRVTWGTFPTTANLIVEFVDHYA